MSGFGNSKGLIKVLGELIITVGAVGFLYFGYHYFGLSGTEEIIHDHDYYYYYHRLIDTESPVPVIISAFVIFIGVWVRNKEDF